MLGFWDNFLSLHYAPEGDEPPPANNNPAPPAATPKPWESEYGNSFDPNRMYEDLKKARDDARSERTKAREHADKLKQYEDQGKSPFERMQSENDALKKQIEGLERAQRDGKVRGALTDAGKAAGALIPEDLFRFIEDGDIKTDSNGNVTNAKDLVDKLKAAKPAIFGRPPGVNAGDRQEAQTTGGINDMIRSAAGRR